MILAAFPPDGISRRVTLLFSDRTGGRSAGPWSTFNLDPRGDDDPEAVRANQEVLATMMGGGVFFPRQVHGRRVVLLQTPPRGFVLGEEGDAVLTRIPGSAVGVLTADCLPVLVWDEATPLAAAIHAGWRGLVAGVIPETVQAMAAAGTPPSRLRGVLGPSIGPCCYRMSPETARLVAEASGESVILPGPDGPRVDLAAAARIQLQTAGLLPEGVVATPLCTSCRPDLFFSHRRDGGVTGRMAAVVRLAGEGEGR